MKEELFNCAARFFGVSRNVITLQIKIDALARNVHDSVNFSYEVEKEFGVEFSDNEIESIYRIGDYLKLLEMKQQHRFKKAA